jgi:alkylhydroperoxidase family enzyme
MTRVSPVPAERAALNLALAAGGCPPSVTDEHFVELKTHFSEDAIIEIVSVIALFGWQNRWNDTLATQLEEHPLEFARAHLAASGWTPGVHAK